MKYVAMIKKNADKLLEHSIPVAQFTSCIILDIRGQGRLASHFGPRGIRPHGIK
jgi:hypothetical protein